MALSAFAVTRFFQTLRDPRRDEANRIVDRHQRAAEGKAIVA